MPGLFCLLTVSVILMTAIAPISTARSDDPKGKYALVIGGASKLAEPTSQEFARNTAAVTEGLSAKGYQVVTLFGGPRVQGSAALAEKSKYAADYAKIGSLQSIPTGHDATSADISAALDALIAKVKRGDQIEIYVAAHGEDSCGELGALIRNDLGSDCQHTFTVFDSQGREVQFPTEKIVDALGKLEGKGALPTLVLNSCHSGRAKSAYKAKGLTKTCAYFQTAGNETGYGCFENDPDFAKDYTSTSEYVSMRYYQQILTKLEKDPYYSKDHAACFEKTLKHFRDKKVTVDTIQSAYWSARLFDSTFQSPSISPLIGLDYFTTGVFSPYLPDSKAMSCSQVNLELDSINRQLPQVETLARSIELSSYRQSIGEYNSTVAKLADAVAAIKTTTNPSPEAIKDVSALQAQVKARATAVVERERTLIESYHKQNADSAHSEIMNSASCERPL